MALRQELRGSSGGFTRIDDPWEPSKYPDVEINTTDMPHDLAVQRILAKLKIPGYIRQS